MSYESLQNQARPSGSDSVEQKSERIDSPEKAFLMAKFEDAARDKAAAYEEYLRFPESRADAVGAEALSFVIWRNLEYAPDDIVNVGKQASELMAVNYDVEKNIQEMEKNGDRIGLIREGMKGLVGVVREDLSYRMRNLKEVFGKSERREPAQRMKDYLECLERISAGVMRLEAMQEAFMKMGQTGEEGKRTKVTEEKLWENAEHELSFASEFTVRPKVSGADAGDFGTGNFSVDLDGESEWGGSENPDILGNIVNLVTKKYEEYLKTEQTERKGNSFFDFLETKNISIEILKKEGVNVDVWVSGLSGYASRLEGMSDDVLKMEATAQSASGFLELASQETAEGSEDGSALRKAATMFYKIFKINREQARRKAGSGEDFGR